MMEKVLYILLITFVVVAFSFAAIGIKVIVKKRGEFKRHCAGVDPYTGKGNGCICQQKHLCDEKKKHPYQPLEVNEELLKEIG